ncbi:MAG: YgiT-type zinc finger protein [Desulfocapsaceae bacterium]|jgi:YgiT-type zinc finger domain-containing protein|nr:YgiT-type zinc finger protein [Desulfocapsaceae bacterium]
MKPFEKCPVCGGDLEDRFVEKLLKGGGNTASIKVVAEVCLHCGERLYAEDVVRSFEKIHGKLKKKQFAHFRTLGQSFTIGEAPLVKIGQIKLSSRRLRAVNVDDKCL